MKTLLLDNTAWDLVLDSNGNIALADNPYAIAQDGASAARTFAGECWYDNTLGVPYFDQILGELPSLQLAQSLVETEVLKVPEVVDCKCTITQFADRTMTGVIEIIDTTGATNNVEFTL